MGHPGAPMSPLVSSSHGSPGVSLQRSPSLADSWRNAVGHGRQKLRRHTQGLACQKDL